MRVTTCAVASAFLLTGCVTTLTSMSYQGVPHQTPTSPTSIEPEKLVGSGNPEDDVAAEAAEGYELIGYSSYDGPRVDRFSENWQAKKVGASRVLAESKFSGASQTGAIGGTTFTRRSAVSFSIPILAAHYDQTILFFAKTPHLGAGVYTQALKPSDQAALGTNKGVKVAGVIRGSPGFAAEVLPGDVILSVNGTAVYDPDSFDAAVRSAYGSTASLAVARNGASITKNLAIPQGGVW